MKDLKNGTQCSQTKEPTTYNLPPLPFPTFSSLITGVSIFKKKLAANPHIAHDNFFKVVSLNLFFTICSNLIKNNVFHNNIFIYYMNNHKCNTGTIIIININLNIYIFIYYRNNHKS